MTKDEFMTHAFLASNLSSAGLAALNWDEIENLPSDSEQIQTALRLWSQFVVGNVSETEAEIEAMNNGDKYRALKVWLEINSDEMELRHIGTFILNMLTKSQL